MSADRPPPARTRGQALAEMALTGVLLGLLAAGTVDFGRAFLITNRIMHAASSGARIAATLPDSYRDGTGCFTVAGRDAASGQVQGAVQSMMNASGHFGSVAIQQLLDGTIPVVTVRITGTINYVSLMALFGNSFGIDRTMTFRDDGRSDGAAC